MESKKLEKPCENATFQALQGVMKPDEETGGVFPSDEAAGLSAFGRRVCAGKRPAKAGFAESCKWRS